MKGGAEDMEMSEEEGEIVDAQLEDSFNHAHQRHGHTHMDIHGNLMAWAGDLLEFCTDLIQP